MATYILKLFAENCGQTAANRDMIIIDSLTSVLSDGTIADFLRLTV